MVHYTFFAALAATVASVSAQSFAESGPGRFPCSMMDEYGHIVADPTQCTYAAMTDNQACPADPWNIGKVDHGGFKNYGPVPSGTAVCTEDAATGNFYCGWADAVCTSDDDCDNGSCTSGKCSGYLGAACTLDSQCLGNFYCTSPDGTLVGFCGGSATITNGVPNFDGAFCQDGCAGGNDLCASGICDGNTSQCVPATYTGASQRARARRALTRRGGAFCPPGHSSCPVSGLAGKYECIDTDTNLEQCGGCNWRGGVDCTAIAGVESVGCVAGRCEVWACQAGFAWDARLAACAPSLA